MMGMRPLGGLGVLLREHLGADKIPAPERIATASPFATQSEC
jgi:hypothetical protein